MPENDNANADAMKATADAQATQKEEASKELDNLLNGRPPEERQPSDQNKDDKVTPPKEDGSQSNDKSDDKGDNKAGDSFTDLLADRTKKKEDLAKQEQDRLFQERLDAELKARGIEKKADNKTEDEGDDKKTLTTEEIVRKVLNERDEAQNKTKEAEQERVTEVDQFININPGVEKYKEKMLQVMQAFPTMVAKAAFILASSDDALLNSLNKTKTSSKPNSNLRQEKDISTMTPEEKKAGAAKELEKILNF